MSRASSTIVEDEIWRHGLHQRPGARSIVSREFLIVPERRTFLARLNAATGSAVWSAKVENSWGWLACTSERVFYLNQHSRVQCHDAETGEAQWAEDLRGYNGWLVPAGSTLLIGGWRGYAPLAASALARELEWPAPRRGTSRRPVGHSISLPR